MKTVLNLKSKGKKPDIQRKKERRKKILLSLILVMVLNTTIAMEIKNVYRCIRVEYVSLNSSQWKKVTRICRLNKLYGV